MDAQMGVAVSPQVQAAVNAVVKVRQEPIKDVVTVNADTGEAEQPEVFVTNLAARLNKAWDAARRAKQAGQKSIQERLLKNERQRNGEYDPDKLQEIRETNGSEVYMMLTSVKCHAAKSWIRDVLTTAGDDVFEIKPANEPELPVEVRAMVVDQVRMEANQAAIEGGVVTPEAVRDRMEEIRDRVLFELKSEAEEAAGRMSNKMRDQLTRGAWRGALGEFLDDFVTFPTAILKGPVIKRQPRVTWGPKYKPVIVNDLVHSFGRVSPYDIYPSPGSAGPQTGFLIERHKLTATDLYAMIGTPGYNDDAIREVIEHYPSGYHQWLVDEIERAELQGRPNSWESEEMDVLEYWGPVSGAELKEWGFKGKLDPQKQYDVNAWWIGPYVIKAVLNPDPLGKRPYDIASWEPIPGSFWGKALPEKMEDVQSLANAAARALSNNLGIASGPQVEVHVDRLPVGEQVTDIHPWKIWQTTSDKTGGGQRAVQFFMPDSNASELMNVYLTFAKQADEVTGIPNYVYGSTSVGGAGRTASGLSMLMDNAAKGIKDAIANIDVVVEGATARLFMHNMVYDSDIYAKGDFRCIAKGASSLIQREALAVRRREFLASTANPIDAQIMGPEGRAYLLKETARALQLDTDRLVPNVPKSWSPFTQQAQMQQMASMQQGGGLTDAGGGAMLGPTDGSVAQTQTLDGAGNPAGGPQQAAV